MLNLLLGLIKPTTKIVGTVINSRRPLAVKGIAGVFAMLGIGLNYEEILPIIDAISQLPYGKFMLGSAIFVTIFATKDVAGCVVNIRKTVAELYKLVATIFKPLILVIKNVCKLKKR